MQRSPPSEAISDVAPSPILRRIATHENLAPCRISPSRKNAAASSAASTRSGEIRRCAVIGIGAASVREIDRINILRASLLAMQRAVHALGILPDAALVDGNIAPALPCRAQAVIGGDGRSLSIAAASIVAKVMRDQIMRELGRRYAGYGWESNVGYATREHCEALMALGATIHHRRSFAPVRVALAGGTIEPELPLESD